MRDISIGETVDFKFTTRQFSDGVPTTAASLAVVAYPGNSITEITAGITTTFTSGFDGVAGLVNVRVVATTGNGYATGTDYALVVSAGTVGGVSIVGEVVGEFSIGRSAAATRVGILTASAATGDPGTTVSVVGYLKQIVNVLIGTAGVTTFPAEAAPANAVSLAEVIRAIHTDVTGLNGAAMRGTDNAGLASELAKVPKSDSTVSWNATALGAINAEVDSAIETYHLDHLLAVDYDPAAKPGTATALLNELVESNGGVSRYTAAALAQAPDTTTGLSLAADQSGVTVGTVTNLTNAPTNGDLTATMKTSVTTAATAATPTAAAVTGSVGSIASGGITDASFDTSTGDFSALGVIHQGTAAGVGAATIDLDASAAFADDELIGCIVYIVSASTGAGQVRTITDYANTNDRATVDTWTTALTGAVVYKVFATPPAPATPPDVNVLTVASQTASATASVDFDDLASLEARLTAARAGYIDNINGHTAQTGDSFALANGAAGFVAIDTVVDAIKAITDALGSAAAANLALSAAGIIGGTTSGTPTTTATDTDLTGYADDELIGRVIVFTGGTADGQAATITDYASTNGVVSFAALTTAPVASDTFVIV